MIKFPTASLPSTFDDSERPDLPLHLGPGHFTALWCKMMPFVTALVRRRLLRAGTSTAIRRVRFAAAGAAPELASPGSVRAAVTHDSALAEDIIQQIGMVLYRHLCETPEEARLYAHRGDAERWLTVTAELVTQRAADRAARSLACTGTGSADDGEPPNKTDVPSDPEQTPDPESALARIRDARRLRAAVARLGDRPRRVVLAELDGLTRDEIATELGTSKENIRVILCRALVELRVMLAIPGGAHGPLELCVGRRRSRGGWGLTRLGAAIRARETRLLLFMRRRPRGAE